MVNGHWRGAFRDICPRCGWKDATRDEQWADVSVEKWTCDGCGLIFFQVAHRSDLPSRGVDRGRGSGEGGQGGMGGE